MAERIWLVGDDGQPFTLTYDELEGLDPEIYPQFLRPVGKYAYSAETFLRLPLAETPFYLQGWLPKQGKSMIYGPSKAGKSFLAIQLARCIGAGEPFLGMPTEAATVLYLQGELGLRVLQKRMETTKQSYEGVSVWTSFSLKLDKREGQDELFNELHLVRPQVLILDPLYKFMSGDENEAHDMVQICDFLDSLIEQFQLSVQLFHHAGKDISRGGRGSSVLEGWVDGSVELRKVASDNEELHARLTPKLLRHAALPPKPYNIVLTLEFEFRLEEQRLSVREGLFAFAQERGDFRMQEVVEAGIGSRRAIYDAKKKLVADGLLIDNGDGTYQGLDKVPPGGYIVSRGER